MTQASVSQVVLTAPSAATQSKPRKEHTHTQTRTTHLPTCANKTKQNTHTNTVRVVLHQPQKSWCKKIIIIQTNYVIYCIFFNQIWARADLWHFSWIKWKTVVFRRECFILFQVNFLHQTVHLPRFHENDIRNKFKIYYNKHQPHQRGKFVYIS